MDFLNLMYRRWIYFSTDPEVLATFFNNRFLLILLVIVLAAMVFLILKHQETLKTAQALERQLTDLQEKLNPEAAQEQTRQQLV